MRWLLMAALLAGARSAASAADSTMLAVVEHDGAACVSAAELERSAGVAIKRLPGADAFVACSSDRCARVKGVFQRGAVTWAPVTALADALGLVPHFSDDRRQVRFEMRPKLFPAGDSVTRVGDLAPNFRVTRLDGSPISLADFRGRRVLIQSWASW